MNMWRPMIKRELTPEASANVNASRRSGLNVARYLARRVHGPFLFGRYGAADAMYAPVVARLHTYGVDVAATHERLYGGGDGAASLERMVRSGD